MGSHHSPSSALKVPNAGVIELTIEGRPECPTGDRDKRVNDSHIPNRPDRALYHLELGHGNQAAPVYLDVFRLTQAPAARIDEDKIVREHLLECVNIAGKDSLTESVLHHFDR